MSLEVVELTSRGTGAVSVLRIRGERAAAAVGELCGGGEILPGLLRRVRLRVGAEDLDEALVCALPGGDLEIHVHGNPVLVRRLKAHLGSSETVRRDSASLEETAAALLASAPCESAARILLDQVEGALRRELRVLALADRQGRGRSVDALLSRWSLARRALEPAEIVIAGGVNAGKSTLFNALLGEARAIVDAEPGTTRDRLRARVRLGAWPAWISDTAGERDPDSAGDAGAVEKEGQARARRARASADLVLWLVPVDGGDAALVPAPREPGGLHVIVRTFGDRAAGSSASAAISALRDPSGARGRVAAIFAAAFSLPADPWVPGAGLPVTSGQARAIARLRDLAGAELEEALEALIDRGGEA